MAKVQTGATWPVGDGTYMGNINVASLCPLQLQSPSLPGADACIAVALGYSQLGWAQLYVDKIALIWALCNTSAMWN